MNPSPRSPATVDKDPNYERVQSTTGNNYMSYTPHVVRHKASNTFWATEYAIRDEDSDYASSASWWEVVPVTKTVVVYEEKKA